MCGPLHPVTLDPPLPLQGGWTPLHRAAAYGHTHIASLLLADPRVMDLNPVNDVRCSGGLLSRHPMPCERTNPPPPPRRSLAARRCTRRPSPAMPPSYGCCSLTRGWTSARWTRWGEGRGSAGLPSPLARQAPAPPQGGLTPLGLAQLNGEGRVEAAIEEHLAAEAAEAATAEAAAKKGR